MDYPFTDDDMEKIAAAYEVLTRVGNQTAKRQRWDQLLDRAHQSLGVILAIRVANGWDWKRQEQRQEQ
jgi:hypothetical protein